MMNLLIDPWTWGDWMWRGMLGSSLVAIPTSILGVFLYLRRRSLVADAHAHLAVPGVVLAFLLTGSISLPVLLAGAIIIGLGASWMIEALSRQKHIRSDAAIGIAFTPLFALGVILLTTAVTDAHIDTHCLLFGDVLGITNRAILTLIVVSGTVVLATVVGWRWIAVSTLDPDYAATIGVPAGFVHYALMSAVSATTMASFEAVGTILVIAMVIVPAATAHLLTDRLSSMLGVALSHGLFSAWIGMYVSVWFNCSTAGAMVVSGGVLYAITLVLAPRHGLIARRGVLKVADVVI